MVTGQAAEFSGSRSRGDRVWWGGRVSDGAGRGGSMGRVPGQVAGFDRSDRAWQVDHGMIPGRSGCGGMGEDPWLHLGPVNPLNGVLLCVFHYVKFLCI